MNNKITATITIVAVIGVGYLVYKSTYGNTAVTQYIIGVVKKGTIVKSISGSGQVSVSNQIDIKSKASGDVVYVGSKNGEFAEAGSLIMQLDTRDAKKAVRDAEINLLRAKLDLEKKNGVTKDDATLRGLKEKANDDLTKSYEDGFNTVANAFLDIPGVMSGLNDVLFGTTLNASGQWNVDYYTDAVKESDNKIMQYRQSAIESYQTAKNAYDKNFEDYRTSNRFSERKTIESVVLETYNTTKMIAEAVKNTTNLIQFYKENLVSRSLKPNTAADTHLGNLNTYTSKTNTQLLNLLSAKNTIQTNKENVAGADIDIASQGLQVRQAENTLQDAEEHLRDYFIRAPFSGIVAKINFKKGEQIGANSIVATVIAKQRIAEISLNEIDAAGVKVGQKAKLTFDALSDLIIMGEVDEIDAVGTVAQGVVSYNAKITFDTQDDRVKPGMSVAAAITIQEKENVLMVPNAAVKSQGEMHIVNVPGEGEFNAGVDMQRGPQTLSRPIHGVPVEVGISNDDTTEIVAGLHEGDMVITRTVTAAATTQNSQQTSSFRIPGLPGGGGGVGGRNRLN